MFNRSRYLEGQRKIARYEKITNYKDKVKAYQEGKGSFIYKNNTPGTLILPKISADGKSSVEKNETWTGDDYYMNMVPAEAILLEIIQEKEAKMENVNEEKLILDQPETVTTEGVVERVVVSDLPLNENDPQNDKTKEVLINESPLDGVKIILG